MPSAVAALEFGADDCLGLPFEPSERVARVAACLRRPLAAVRPDRLTAGPLVPTKPATVCWCRAEKSHSRRPSSACSRSCSKTRAESSAVPSSCVAPGRKTSRPAAGPSMSTSAGLRQLLEPFGCDDIIQTVRSFGYRLALRSPAPRRPTAGAARQPPGCNKSATANSFSLNMARLLWRPIET